MILFYFILCTRINHVQSAVNFTVRPGVRKKTGRGELQMWTQNIVEESFLEKYILEQLISRAENFRMDKL